MSNMSHCRFQNTIKDLLECKEHLFDYFISGTEETARQLLIETCREIVQEEGREDYYSEEEAAQIRLKRINLRWLR